MDHDFGHLAYGIVSLLIIITVGLFTYHYREKLKHLKKYGFVGLFLLSLIGNIAVLSPTNTLISFAGGKLYSPIVVGLVIATGSIVGEILTYNLGVAGEIAIHHNDWYDSAKAMFEKNGFITSMLMTSIPNPFVNFAGLIAGSLGYSFWKFILASFLGNWIQYTICAFLGKKILKK